MKSLGSLREEGEVLTEKTEEAEGVQPGGLERGAAGGGEQTGEARTRKVAASAFSPLWMGPLQSRPQRPRQWLFQPRGEKKGWGWVETEC